MTPQQQSALAVIDACIVATAEAARVLRQSLSEAPAPPPIEPPPPPPIEPPPPPPIEPPAPAPFVPSLTLMNVNTAAEVLFDQWSPLLSRYTRAQGILRLSGPAAKVKIIGYAGQTRALTGGTYTLLIDGAQAVAITPAAGALEATFEVNADALAPGWHELRVEPSVPSESCIPYYALVVHNGVAGPCDWVPVARGSYSLALNPPRYWFGKAPAVYSPTKLPLAPRERAPFSTLLPASQLHVEQLVPVRNGDTHRVCKTKEGVLTSFANQCYNWSDMLQKTPHVPLLDGPRGVGTVCMPTHLEVGTAAPPSLGFINNTYFCDPWRVGKVRADGNVTTLVGYRHKGIAAHWQDMAPDLDLVGDWSAIPAERRGFHEIWGMAWDRRRTGANNVGAPSPDPRERGLIPHPPGGGMVIFLADSQNNRIVRCEFPHDTHFDYNRTKVTEFLAGLADPWDCVGDDAGILYVSERKAHRICAYSMDTGALLRVVVQGQALATVGADREARRVTSLDATRAAVCVAPEGLFLQDGWLYWGSRAQAQVKRVNIESGAVEVVHNIVLDDNVKFVKIALSDGSFGPRGLLAMATWSAADFGWSRFSPGWDLGSASYNHVIAGQNAHFNYPTAVGFGGGQLVIGGVNEGMLRVTKRLLTDTAASAAAKAGAKEWVDSGLYLLHGHFGFGFYGLPLPWGTSANIDAYLSHNGHQR